VILSPLDKRCQLVLLPEHGGACHRLCFTADNGNAIDVLAGCSDAELAAGNPWYRGAWLYPFTSRLANGRYTWQGIEYQFQLNAPDGKSALHGFLSQLTPIVLAEEASQDTATITVKYEYEGDVTGYPFPAELTLEYRLQSPADLIVTLAVQNRHDAAVPVGVGWHPYFFLKEPVDDLYLSLPAGNMAVLDAQLLPSGEALPFHDFETLVEVGDKSLDGSLKLDVQSSVRVRMQLWSELHQVGVAMWQDTGEAGEGGYRHLQVFIPPDRQSIALEPVSCGVNAFNTGENLLTLEPGATQRFTCGVSLLTRRP
jgi:aldose 1-epimerase